MSSTSEEMRMDWPVVDSKSEIEVKMEAEIGGPNLNFVESNGNEPVDHYHEELESKPKMEESSTSTLYRQSSGLIKKSPEVDEFGNDVKDDANFIESSTSARRPSRINSHVHTPLPDNSNPTSSASPTPFKEKSTKKKKEAPIGVTQFIHHLPRAEEQAIQEFEVLEQNTFQFKSLGRSGQQEDMMVCDCVFDPDEDDADQACGPHSNCINRLTQVECLRNECQTGRYCMNQRFSKRQYAPVEVVQTEKKGYGLRAGDDLVSDEFIYEYIGEVVSQTSFLKRMQAYADEGIQHFYFMMLQREEYLDATKKGGIARFANHSCNPNCYVAKWVVGKRMRMGIFAKRDIQRGEELTFNYNVDRYGHTAQICYCDEPNCVGTIGGKTQTDLGGMDDLYIDALGIADDVEALGLKGTKKKKGRKLDEDFVPILKPMGEPEVPKVVAAIRQCTNNRGMLCKLLDRVKMTEDDAVKRQLMRMHGFSLMWTVMTESPEDTDILRLVLGIMINWKLTIRNKVEDAKIEEPVTQCLQSPHEDVQQAARDLLSYWSGLQSAYRIPRKIVVPDAVDDALDDLDRETTPPDMRRPRHLQSSWETAPGSDFKVAPIRRANGFNPYKPKPVHESAPATPATSAPVYDKARLEAILALARVNQEAGAAAAAQHLKSEGSDATKRERHRDRNKDSQRKKPKISEEERKEKKLSRMVGEVVVRNMSKYRDQMEKDTFKQYAKECTAVLVSKEKKHPTYLESKLESLSNEKQEKMKAFIKEYSHKVLKKLKEKGKLKKQNSQLASTSSLNMPSSHHTAQDAQQKDADFVNSMFGPELDEDGEDEDMDATSGQRAESLAPLGSTPDDGSTQQSPMDALAQIKAMAALVTDSKTETVASMVADVYTDRTLS